MHNSQAQLLIGKLQKGREYIENLKKELYIKPYNVLVFDTRLKIADAREIKVFFSKLGTEREKHLVVLFDGATLDAQNALLKTLEEIPNHAYICWLAESEHDVLPTILSRCTIVMLEQELMEITNTRMEQYIQHITENSIISYATALLLGEQIQTLDDYSLFIQTFESVLKKQIYENQIISPVSIEILEKVSSFYPVIESNNVNPRLIIEAILLSKSNLQIAP